ncbi:MAG TPA: DUF2993 domain-containing protein, partial [Chloroflexi bacterium]|nr:DUF2993 domain-containing protein [Chloroflexota bacterium]
SCCNALPIGGPQPPHEIAPSEEAIQKLRERWKEALDVSPDGAFDIAITETEMTALANKALATIEEPPPIENLQIHFQDSLMNIYATVTVHEALPIPAMVALSVSAANGEINVSVKEAEFGGLTSMPSESAMETVTNIFNDLVDQIIQDEIGKNVAITDVQIEEGKMTLSGTLNAE